MSVWLSLEKRKSFPIPYDELFRICEQALLLLSLEITRQDDSLGLIEAQKPATWPFKSKQRISLTVGRDSRVVAIAKIDMNKAPSAPDLITDKFFDAVQELLRNPV